MKDGNRWKSYCKVGLSHRQHYVKIPGFVKNKPTSANMLVLAHYKGALNRLHIESISEFQIYTEEIERIMNLSPYDRNFGDIDEFFET